MTVSDADFAALAARVTAVEAAVTALGGQLPAPPVPVPLVRTGVVEDTATGIGVGQVAYAGTWVLDGSYHYGYTVGDSYSVRWWGRQLRVFGVTEPAGGILSIVTDGATPVLVDTHAAAQTVGALIHTTALLPLAVHTTTVTITANTNGSAHVGEFDHADVYAQAGDPAAPTNPPTPAPVPVPVPTPAAGSWLSGAGVADPYAFGAWRGRALDVWETWNNFPTWPQMRSLPTVHQYFTGEGTAPFNKRFPGRLSFSQPLWAQGETASATAGGGNDGNFLAIAQGLVAAGFGNAFIRLGWEHNGSWFWWHATDANTTDWVAAFRRVYGIFKGVSSGFQIVWNPNKSSDFGYDVRKSYPGSDGCDLVGVDEYNMYPAAHTQADWDAQYMQTAADGSPIGPGAWRAYVASLGKDIAWPEWGQDWPNSGDDTVYVQQMHTLFGLSGPRTRYESYFDLGGDFQLDGTTHFPSSAALYRRLFGS